MSRGARTVSAFLLLALCLLPSACVTLRLDVAKIPSQALPPDPATPLARMAQEPLAGGGESAFRLLRSGRAALAARLALVEGARRSLDLQYYIFHADASGRLLAEALLRAADRGVRVRLLLDDMYTAEQEPAIIALNGHPNIEIRLYNPFNVRGNSPLGRLAEFLGDTGRLNRRMHNKLFLADGVLGITGGRNIGDEYFQLEDPRAFMDLDVLATGRVVGDLAAAFDTYWNADPSVPVAAIPREKSLREMLAALRADLDGHRAEVARALTEYLALDVLGAPAGEGFGAWSPGGAEVLLDPPDKTAAAARAQDLPAVRLMQMGLDARRELLIASPYFVPGRLGLDVLGTLRHRGVEVSVLTNSLASSDVALVHAGYARYRQPLLLAGVRLYEFKALKQKPAARLKLGGGSSRASLHGKALVFDRQAVYIGSMNLDPRSVLLNTEGGLVIRSGAFAGQVAVAIEEAMGPERSYRVRLNPDADPGPQPLVWQETSGGEEIIHTWEPRTGLWMRFLIDLLSGFSMEPHL